MVVWDLTRKIGLVLIIVAVIAAIGATIIGIATGGTGTWIGPLTGVFILVTFGVVALPLWLQSRSKMRHFQRIVADGPRITAVVEAVYEEYVDPEASSDSRRYWSVGARGPKLDGGDQFYNQMIGKTKPNLRKGDEITIALDPTDPDKYAMLIPEMSQYFGDARPTGSTAMWNQNDAERRGPFYEN